MAGENPLLIMGVPRAVIVREKALGSIDVVLKVAEANYRSFAKRYASDLSEGDAELMVMFSQAIEELRDPDALEFYIEELVGATDVQDLYLRKQAQQVVSRDTEALSRMAAGLAFVDQFEMLGITESTSYILGFHGQRIVLDVMSTTTTRCRTTNLPPEVPISASFNGEMQYRKGVWHEAYVDGSYRKHWVPFEEFISDEVVRVVGLAPHTLVRDTVISNPPHRALTGTSSRAVLGWQAPLDCWFLRGLHYDRNAEYFRTVLFKHGQFAVTDQLMGSAPFVAS